MSAHLFFSSRPSIPLLQLLLACFAFPSFAGESAPAARISHVYPDPDEQREPDRTLAHAETGAISVLQYDPPGRLLLVGGADGVIQLRDAATGEKGTGEVLRSLTGHTAAVRALGYRDGGKTIVSYADDQTVRTWNATNGEPLRTWVVKTTAKRVAFCSSNAPLLALVEGTRLKLVNYESGAVVRNFEAQDAPISCLAVRPDGGMLATATENNVIQLWNPSLDKPARTIDALSEVQCLALDANHVAAGCRDGTVQVWPIEGAQGVVMLQEHTQPVNALAFDGKSDQVASASSDKTVKVWDLGTERVLCTQVGHPGGVVSVIFNPNGQKMASGDEAGNLDYWTVPLPPIAPADLEKIKAALPGKATAKPKKPRKLLVFWRADAILHKSGVPAANHAIALLGEKTGAFTADFSRDYAALDAKVLSGYDAIVLNSTAHLAIPESAKHALLEFAQHGGGVIGIHAAIDTFRDWPEGAAIIGATFGGHPWIPSGNWAVRVDEPEHPLNRVWGGKSFRMHDEFYELAKPYSRSDRQVLLTLDPEDPATAGVKPIFRKDKDYAVSWIKKCGEGRVFYCMFGHNGEVFQNPAVLQFELDGIQYALGDLD